MDWKTMLAYISGSVDEELLLRNVLWPRIEFFEIRSMIQDPWMSILWPRIEFFEIRSRVACA